jgi:hypothetical protein
VEDARRRAPGPRHPAGPHRGPVVRPPRRRGRLRLRHARDGAREDRVRHARRQPPAATRPPPRSRCCRRSSSAGSPAPHRSPRSRA